PGLRRDDLQARGARSARIRPWGNDVRLDRLPKDHARCAAAGIVGGDGNSIAIGFAEELDAGAFVERDGRRIGRRGDRLDVLATVPPSELDEVAEKLLPEASPAGRRTDGDRMHVSDRLGLREKAKQIRDDLGSVANDERGVAKLVNEEWMVQVA